MTEDIKICYRCNQFLTIDNFYKHPRTTDKTINICKKCKNKDTRERYRKNKELCQEYEKQRFKNPERKEKLKVYQKNRRKNNPLKTRAYYAISNAIKRKKITAPAVCSLCGKAGKIQAHHEDYAKPLDVLWLCFECHRRKHGQNIKEVVR